MSTAPAPLAASVPLAPVPLAPAPAIPTSLNVAPYVSSELAPRRKFVLKPSAEVNLALYAAMIGKPPEIDPLAGRVPTLITEPEQYASPWSPTMLSIYLQGVYRTSVTMLSKPELAAWAKKQGASAKKRILETQVRLAAMRNDRAA